MSILEPFFVLLLRSDLMVRRRAIGSRPSVMASERVSVNPDRMGGLPCIGDLRATLGMILGQLATGRTVEQVLFDYPYLARAEVLAALEFAAAAVNECEVPVARSA
jgi:uncharacterized protein (DUF433 family)